ncbi:MAG: segregation/condensation protein A [Ponticaulis sp.]|nr:segregation/condensation protein A [Ponticaulis sp.]|tara:strand:+ start:2811 stop:3659 length:849 start_codon:yes stop_codon:yes gene_type:complete
MAADGLITGTGKLDSSEFDIDQAEAFLVDVDGFEGPLHLLLAMARRQKVDMRRVSILELAEQYLVFISDARDKRIDLAADYLLMAAWLAFLKSRLLLPKPEKADKDDVSADDLAARLAFRLQRLDAMREGAESLMAGDLLGRDVFVRGEPEKPVVIKRPQYTTRLIDLMAAFSKIQSRKTREKPHEVVKQYVLPLENARLTIEKVLPTFGDRWASLNEVAEQNPADMEQELPTKCKLASIFAASLDLTKARKIDLRQDGYRMPVFVRQMAESDGESQNGFEN